MEQNATARSGDNPTAPARSSIDANLQKPPQQQTIMPPHSVDDTINLKECARCGATKTLADISEVRLRVGGTAVFICKACKHREQTAPLLLGYECPGWKYGREGYRCPRLRFHERLPPVEKLVGHYHVVFFAADQAFGPRYHRKTKGTMTISLKEEDGCRGKFLILGTIQMDRKMAISDTPWIDQFSFLQDNSTELSFTGFEKGAFLPYHGRQHASLLTNQNDASLLQGQMRIVHERTAVRSRPDAKGVNKVRQRPITFHDTNSAEKIQAEYTNSIAPWLSRNIGFPDLVSSHICEFWCTRPPPLFFFEPGDLCLTTMWPRKGYMYDDVATMLVARRRLLQD